MFVFCRACNTNHCDFVRGLSWHPKDKRLYTCGWDFKVLSRDLATLEEKMEVQSPVNAESQTINGITEPAVGLEQSVK